MTDIWVSLFITCLGLAVGSFLNVCIYRIPIAGISVHSPRRSFCPQCADAIRFYDNIPLVSYVVLRGRCRACRTKIPVRYLFVELLTAALFLLMYYRFGLGMEFLLSLAFVSVLVPIAVIDAQHYIIPNVLVGAGLILGLVLVGGLAYQRGDVWYLLTRLIGAVSGAAVLWLVSIVGSAVFRKNAMGRGDVKLMAVNGLFLGAWPELLLVIALPSLSGAIVGSVLIAVRGIDRRRAGTGGTGEGRGTEIPYGPFLAVAALLVLLWGDRIWETYLRVAGWN